MPSQVPAMKPQPSSEETLFQAALLLPAPARAAFLNGACAADPALRARLEALLSAHEQSETLMATKVDAQQPSFLPKITAVPDEAVGQMLGRYKLLQQIGEGGCDTVFMAELVNLRYFAGFSFEETAEVLGIAVPTAKQWWAYARAWMRVEMASQR